MSGAEIDTVFMKPLSLAVHMTCGGVKFEDAPVLLKRDGDKEFNWVPMWFAIGALRKQVDVDARAAARSARKLR